MLLDLLVVFRHVAPESRDVQSLNSALLAWRPWIPGLFTELAMSGLEWMTVMVVPSRLDNREKMKIATATPSRNMPRLRVIERTSACKNWHCLVVFSMHAKSQNSEQSYRQPLE